MTGEELETNRPQFGMTTRTFMATQFFASMLANPYTASELGEKPQDVIERRLAALACEMADALILALDPPVNFQ